MAQILQDIMRQGRRPSTVLAVCAGLCACEPEGRRGADSRPWEAPTGVLGAEQELVIESTDEVILYRVGDVVFIDGGIVVMNAGDASILWYSDRGELRQAVGGKGQGPGEYETLSAIRPFDDGIVAWDISLRRLTFYSATGDLLHVVSVREGGAWRLVGQIGDGLLTLAHAPQSDVLERRFLRVDETGSALEFIGPPFSRGVLVFPMEDPRSPSPVLAHVILPGCYATSFPLPGRGFVTLAEASEGTLRVLVPSSNLTVHDWRRLRPGDRITEAHREKVRSSIARAPGDSVKAMVNRLGANGRLPAWDAAVTGRDGTFFLRRARCEQDAPEFREWDLVTLDEEPVRTLRLSGQLVLKGGSRDRVAVVAVDSLDVERLEILQLRHMGS